MNFPGSPSIGDTYSLGTKTWKWNGVAWDLVSTGLTSTHVVTALGFTPLNKAGDTITGNLAFSGTGLRINGDFSNATMSSRTLFQSSTANGNTQIGAIPNGTAVNSAFFTYNNSDPTNASTGILRINASEVALISGITGTGTYLPLVFLTNNLERGRFDTSGNWGVGTSAPKVRAQFSAGSAVNAPTLGTAGGVAYFTNNDAAYGLLVGTSAATGEAWFQAQRTDSTATAYDISLNPAGGDVKVGTRLLVNGITVGRGAGAVATNTAVGASALAANTSGANNTGNGMSALVSNTTGSRNSAIGRSALGSNDVGADNSAFGYFALQNNTSGTANTALGVSALQTNTTASNNTAVGYQAGYSNTGTGQTFIGYQAGYTNTSAIGVTFIGSQAGYASTGNYNTAVGSGSSTSVTSGTDNTALGYDSYANGATSTGSYNTALGRSALRNNTTASNNTAVGYQAGYSNTTGNVTAFGQGSLYSNVTGDGNSAFGVSSLTANTGNYNSAFGWRSGYSNTSGTQNAFVGYATGYANTTGGYNTAMGNTALYTNTTGSYNTAIGVDALRSNTTASNSTAVGYRALLNSTAQANTGFGYQAGYSFTSGVQNVAIGDNASYSNQTGNYSIAVGSSALQNATAGANIGVGTNAGANITTGFYNVYVGHFATASAVSNTYEVVLGSSAGGITGKGSSTAFISPNAGACYQGNNSSSWSTTSDFRLKKNIVDNHVGLDAITSIRVRNFEYRLPEEVDPELKPTDAIDRSGVQLGVIAQELQAVLPDCVKQESTGVLSVDTDNLTWYLINAVKQLKAEIDQLKGN